MDESQAAPPPSRPVVDVQALLAEIDRLEHLVRVSRVVASGRNPADALPYLALARDGLTSILD